jgi:hypothetical protein
VVRKNMSGNIIDNEYVVVHSGPDSQGRYYYTKFWETDVAHGLHITQEIPDYLLGCPGHLDPFTGYTACTGGYQNCPNKKNPSKPITILYDEAGKPRAFQRGQVFFAPLPEDVEIRGKR